MTITSDQPTPGVEKVRCCLRERSLLVGQHLQREPRIQFRIIPSPPTKLTVLVVLDEMVVRIPRERQRIEAQRVDTRKLKQTKLRISRLEVRYIEADQIVTEQEFRALGKLIEAAKRLLNVAAPMSHGFAGTAADGGKLKNAPGFASDLEIDRQTTRSEFLCSRRDRRRSTHYPARLDDVINDPVATLRSSSGERASSVSEQSGLRAWRTLLRAELRVFEARDDLCDFGFERSDQGLTLIRRRRIEFNA